MIDYHLSSEPRVRKSHGLMVPRMEIDHVDTCRSTASPDLHRLKNISNNSKLRQVERPRRRAKEPETFDGCKSDWSDYVTHTSLILRVLLSGTIGIIQKKLCSWL